jgi:hypothetical protein
MIEPIFNGHGLFKIKLENEEELYWILCRNKKLYLGINNNTHELTINPFQENCQKMYDQLQSHA